MGKTEKHRNFSYEKIILIKAKESEVQREAGNAQFYAGNYKQALILYSMAVFRSPKNAESMALALANRSACLQQMKSFAMALEDIEMAIDKTSLLQAKAMFSL